MLKKRQLYTRLFISFIAINPLTSSVYAMTEQKQETLKNKVKLKHNKRSMRPYQLFIAPLLSLTGAHVVASQSVETSLRGARSQYKRDLESNYDAFNLIKSEDGFDHIINGVPAGVDQYKFFAMLIQDYGRDWEWHGCGATLIADNVALTAAHCLDKEVPNAAIIGALSPWGSNNGGQISVKMRIKETVIHPRYNARFNRYDFALLMFENTIGDELASSYGEENRHEIKPIAIAGDDIVADMEDYDPVSVVGFGRMANNQAAYRLQTADIDYISTDLCRDFYSPSRISDDMVCGSANGQSSCYGDSGGPLIDRFSSVDPVLLGVVSWGTNEGCEGYLPGVYGKPAEAIDWIKKEACPHLASASNTDDFGKLCSAGSVDPNPNPGEVSLPVEGPFTPGSPIVVDYENLPPSNTHWLALYKEGDSSENYDSIDWSYLPDTRQSPSGSLQLDGPLSQGSYEVRLFLNDSYRIHQVIKFQVKDEDASTEPEFKITLSNAGPFAPRSMIQISYQDLPPSNTHWIGIYRRNAPNTSPTTWRYIPSTIQNSEGTTRLRAPNQPGQYQLRSFLNDSWTIFEITDFVVR